MKIRAWIRTGILAATSIAATGSLAHHSVSGQFDTAERIELNGVISKVDWVNPHIYLHLEIKNETGETETWRLETVPPAFLYRAEVTPDMLQGSGKPVRIEALRAHDRTQNLGYVIRIHYAEGHNYQLSADY